MFYLHEEYLYEWLLIRNCRYAPIFQTDRRVYIFEDKFWRRLFFQFIFYFCCSFFFIGKTYHKWNSIWMCDLVDISMLPIKFAEKKELRHRTRDRYDRELKKRLLAFPWPRSRISRGYVSTSRSTWTLARSSALWIVVGRTVCFRVYGTCLPCRVSLYCFMPGH